MGIAFYLYEVSGLPRIYGGEFFGLRNYALSFFKVFKTLKFELFVVFDGIPPVEKRGVIQERRRSKCSTSLNLLNRVESGQNVYDERIPITRPNTIKRVLISVLK